MKSIKRAEKKMKEGTYGICEHCGKEIDSKRLNCFQARLCIDCARKEDRETIGVKEQTMKKAFGRAGA